MTGRFRQALSEKGDMPKKFSVKSGDKSAEGGLTAKGVKRYRAANPGSKLKTAVTTKPSKLKKGSKSAKRRKSFCARMGGMKKRLTSAKTRRDPDSRINKALRKWNCSTDVNPNALQQMAEMVLESLLENRYGNKKNRTGKKQRLGQFRKERNTAANQGEDKTERGQKILRTAGGISRGGGPRPKFRASTSQQDFEAGKMSTLRGRKSRDDIYDPNAKADLPQGEPEKKDRVAQARSAMAGAFGGAKSAFGRARAGGSAFMSGLKHGWRQGTTPSPLFRKKKPAKKPDDTETEVDKQKRANARAMSQATGISASTEIVRNARQGLAEMILNAIQENDSSDSNFGGKPSKEYIQSTGNTLRKRLQQRAPVQSNAPGPGRRLTPGVEPEYYPQRSDVLQSQTTGYAQRSDTGEMVPLDPDLRKTTRSNYGRSGNSTQGRTRAEINRMGVRGHNEKIFKKKEAQMRKIAAQEKRRNVMRDMLRSGRMNIDRAGRVTTDSSRR